MQFLGRFLLSIGVCIFALTHCYAASDTMNNLNMPYGVSTISREIYNLHMAGFYVCCGIGALVFSVLIYSLFKFRHSKGAQAAHFHEHLGVEILWTTIPFLILVALAIPATIVLQHIHNTDESGLTIKITGYQWKWKYEYLDQGISFFSNLTTSQDQINNKAPKGQHYLQEVDNQLVVPINTKVKLLVTADDVIHSWWVPDIGVKQDAVPGYINENWVYITVPGTYRGACGELCGVNHAFMPIVVKAVTQADFNLWVQGFQHNKTSQPEKTPTKKLTKEAELSTGQQQFDKTCAMCHQTTGLGLPPTFPALKGSKIATGKPEDTINVVVHGVPGTAMQAFGEQLDNQTLAAVISYVRNAWGNGELNDKNHHAIMVQPEDVSKLKN